MKVIYDNQIFFNQNFGGPSRYFVELVKELNKINNNSLIISPFHQNIYLKNVSLKYKKELTTSFKKNIFLNKINNFASSYFFKNIKHDLYHLTYFDKCYQSNKPKIITVYDLIHEKFSNDFNLNLLPKKKIFKNMNHFLCISENTKKDLINYYNIDEKRITVTYLANSLKSKEVKKFKSIKPFFLYVGSRKRYKNFELLLKSYSLNKKIINNFDIVCFGGGKFVKEEIENIKNLSINLNSIHHIEGSDEILSSLYSSAEALIYPSKYEGFGLPILEAMSFGCPVISSNASSLPEVYGDAALTFSPTSSENLIHCIEKITNDSELRKTLIKKGYNREKIFTWKKCANETNELYKKLV